MVGGEAPSGICTETEERPAWKQTGQEDAADWRLLDQFVGFGGGQCLPVGQTLDQIKPGRLGATHTGWFPVCLALLLLF